MTFFLKDVKKFGYVKKNYHFFLVVSNFFCIFALQKFKKEKICAKFLMKLRE